VLVPPDAEIRMMLVLQQSLNQERENFFANRPEFGKEAPTDVQNKPVLVPPDAEIRMMLVLQQSLNQERENFFANRPEFGRDTPTDADKARIERMYHQQGSLAELFDSLSQSLLGPEPESPLGPTGDEPGPGAEGQEPPPGDGDAGGAGEQDGGGADGMPDDSKEDER
jgi:hypothetical protein